jgi:acyl carrier protein
MSEIMRALNAVFRDVFDDEHLSIKPETSAVDIEGWDSLTHVTLILQVERTFGVRFTSSEVAALRSAGDLEALVAARSPSN